MDHALVIQRLERPSRVEEYYRDVEAAKEEVAKRYPWFMLARESSKELCARVERDPFTAGDSEHFGDVSR